MWAGARSKERPLLERAPFFGAMSGSGAPFTKGAKNWNFAPFLAVSGRSKFLAPF